MVIINHIDLNVSKDFYENNIKSEGKWFGDYSFKKGLEFNLKESEKKKNNEEIKVYENSLSLLNKNEKVKFYLLPNSKFIIYSMLSLFLIGFLILFFSKRITNDAAQSIAGLIAGLFLWTGLEFSLLISARILGIAKKITVFKGKLIGEYGEYILMKYSWGFLLIIIAYMLFLECSRCNFFCTLEETLIL